MTYRKSEGVDKQLAQERPEPAVLAHCRGKSALPSRSTFICGLVDQSKLPSAPLPKSKSTFRYKNTVGKPIQHLGGVQNQSINGKLFIELVVVDWVSGQ